ncbi:MAG: polyprenyl synthetase family protein [Candidatus Sumerlaeia bacterium]|nr:polyprenyl synthetase family protein [Candidatus Sumerlaeia bacterium]
MLVIDKYCQEELQKIDALLDEITRTSEPIIKEVTTYIRQSPGKRLRPKLVILSGKLFGHQGEETIKMGAGVELLHTATLLHDDILDKAQTRRGKPSVNAKWGDEIALLVADYYFAQAFNCIFATGFPQLAELLVRVATKMCEGELYQQERKNEFLSSADYFKIIKFKTAYLFSACAQFGAIISNASESVITALQQFGLHLGMAFQIIDDSLDFIATDENWGKPIGNDIAQGKQTLPFIYALEVASEAHKDELRYFFSNGRNLTKILHIIKKYDGFKYAEQTANYYIRQAKQCLTEFPDTEQKRVLLLLADYIVSRTF